MDSWLSQPYMVRPQTVAQKQEAHRCKYAFVSYVSITICLHRTYEQSSNIFHAHKERSMNTWFANVWLKELENPELPEHIKNELEPRLLGTSGQLHKKLMLLRQNEKFPQPCFNISWKAFQEGQRLWMKVTSHESWDPRFPSRRLPSSYSASWCISSSGKGSQSPEHTHDAKKKNAIHLLPLLPGGSCTKSFVDFLLNLSLCEKLERCIRTKKSGCINPCVSRFFPIRSRRTS